MEERDDLEQAQIKFQRQKTKVKFDAFLSYNGEDRSEVRRLAKYLEGAHLSVWFDELMLIPGQRWIEELYSALDVSKTCIVFVGKSGSGPWQKPEIEAALQKNARNPKFRLIPVLLPSAPKKPELPPFISNYHWVDFKDGLDSKTALLLLECGIRGIKPKEWKSRNHNNAKSKFDFFDDTFPGNALTVDSNIYMEREADEKIFKALSRERVLVTLLGPRKFGKTSLLLRAYNYASRLKKTLRVLLIDFQTISEEEFNSLTSIWKNIAYNIIELLKVDKVNRREWRDEYGCFINLYQIFEECIFKDDQCPLLICLDCVDRVFQKPIKNDFFSYIRSLYERGAVDNNWKNVYWILSTSTEPSFFVDDIKDSPFNIAEKIELKSFNFEQVADFISRFNLNIEEDLFETILGYLGGHPYLTHLLLHEIAQGRQHEQLFDPLTGGGGIFRNHLQRFLIQFRKEPNLSLEMKNIINEKGCKDISISNRLEAAGLICRNENQNLVSSCKLYADFFNHHL